MKSHVLTILAIIAFSISAISQEQPEVQKNLMQFAGKWICENPKIKIGDKMYTGEYTFDCSSVNMNTGILAHEKFLSDEINLLGENLFGYDPNLNQVHLYSIDNT